MRPTSLPSLPHKVKHTPPSGTGYATCDCGATVWMEKGQIRGLWHACTLCVLPSAHRGEATP